MADANVVGARGGARVERGSAHRPEDAPPDDPGNCAECGFDTSTVSDANAVEEIQSLGRRYHTALTGPEPDDDPQARLRQRPGAGGWSPLEYAAHVRDVIALWGSVLHRTLVEDRPTLPAIDPELADRAAIQAAYNSQDPASVDGELSANAERMANKVATIDAGQWGRRALLGDAEVTPLWIVRKVAHEGHHHLVDIESRLRPGQRT